MTSTLDFDSPDNSIVTLPGTAAYLPPGRSRHPDYDPLPPALQDAPAQEHGIRPARPLPYELHAWAQVSFSAGVVTIHFGNTGKATAVYQVRSANTQTGPWTYTISPHAPLSDTWSYSGFGQTAYDLSVYGPNGFLREFKGSIAASDDANLELTTQYDTLGPGITLTVRNRGAQPAQMRIRNVYTQDEFVHTLAHQETVARHFRLEDSFGWYDFLVQVDADPDFQRRLSGHVETGRASMSDPALAGLPL